MSSINAINSQLNFTGAKNSRHASKADNKPNVKELGGRTFEEKYSKDGEPVNVTTANLGILGGDFILDHAIEIGLAAITFVALALKGRSLMNGVTGSIVDTTKQMADTTKSDKLGVTKKFSNYIHNTIENIKKTKSLGKKDANGLKNNAEGFVKENAKKTVMENSVIDKLAKKADNPDSLFSKFVKKVSKNPNAGSDDVRNFFAKKFGITRGADIVDNAVALGAAGGASGVVHSVTDVMTDLNDEEVAKKAAEANRRYEEAQTKAEKKAIKKELKEARMAKVGKAAGQLAEII